MSDYKYKETLEQVRSALIDLQGVRLPDEVEDVDEYFALQELFYACGELLKYSDDISKLIVEVRDGCVQRVYGDQLLSKEAIEFVVVDYDDVDYENEDCVPDIYGDTRVDYW